MTDPTQQRLPSDAGKVPSFRIGEWIVEPALNRITNDSGPTVVEPRMMHVLVCLASVSGQVISRQELLDVVWRDVVVGEEALTRSVSRLRILLGDDKNSPRFLETIRGRGYRLLVEVEAVAEDSVVAPAVDPAVDPAAGPSTAPATAPTLRATARRYPTVVAAAVALVLAAAGILWQIGRDSEQPAAGSPARAVPFTTYPGSEGFPVFTPDGENVVFYWSGGDDQAPGLFLKHLDNEQPRRLTEPDGRDTYPAISPDGMTVAFYRRTTEGHSIRSVSRLGGAVRLLAETPSAVFGITWSPRGDGLVFAARSGQTGQYCLQRLDPATLQVTPLTTVDDATHTGDSWPAFSPDGESIAFARCDHAGLRNLWIVPASGGEGRAVTSSLSQIDGLTWLPGGREVIVCAGFEGQAELWKVRIDSGERSRLSVVAPGEVAQPTVAGDGSRLAFCSRTYNYDFRLVDLAEDNDAGEPSGFLVSTRNELYGAWSPDGDRVVFRSDRSGWPEVWSALADGSNPRRLTSWQGVDIGRIFWAPDGRRVAVNVVGAGHSWVEILDTATSKSHPLRTPQHQRCCGWIMGENTISLLRDVGPTWRLFRLHLGNDSETPCDLELPSHPTVFETPAGLFYTHPHAKGLWHSPPDGSAGTQIVTDDEMADWRALYVSADGLYVIRTTDEGRQILELFDPATGDRRLLREISERSFGLAVSPDGKQALLNVLESVESDLMTIRGPVH